ncbi:MAG: hypothetical protein ACRD0W_23000 [Acidimicrobiales bacterium]
MPVRTIENVLADMRSITDAAADRLLSDEEVAAYEGFELELAVNRRDGEVRARQTAYETPVDGGLAAVGALTPDGDPEPRNPLAYDAHTLDALQDALNARSAGRYPGLPTREQVEVWNATLTTSTFGQPGAWGSNVIDGPRLLHVAAGVTSQPIEAVLAEHPQLTLPTAQAAVGEGVTLAEYATSTGGTVTLGRFGRWTDLSKESTIGTDAGSLIGMHQVGIALDLDKVLIDAVNTAAGAAVGFTADVPAAIRKAMATVIAATALQDPTRLVVLVHPDNIALLQDVSPIGGRSIAEEFQRFSGALVYPSSSVPTGFMLVANLMAGCRFFEAQAVFTETDANVKTGVQTVATSTIAGYGIGVVGAFVSKVDVVTP